MGATPISERLELTARLGWPVVCPEHRLYNEEVPSPDKSSSGPWNVPVFISFDVGSLELRQSDNGRATRAHEPGCLVKISDDFEFRTKEDVWSPYLSHSYIYNGIFYMLIDTGHVGTSDRAHWQGLGGKVSRAQLLLQEGYECTVHIISNFHMAISNNVELVLNWNVLLSPV